MKKHCLITALCLAVAFCYTATADGLVIKGCFPLRQGSFWNFSDTETADISSWTVIGSLSLRDIGKVHMMLMENGRILCLREDWQGIQMYAEFGSEEYRIPAQPALFLPRDIEVLPDAPPVTRSVDMEIFTMPPGSATFARTATEPQTVSFLMKGYDIVTIDDKTYTDCIIIEKSTSDPGGPVTETIWLAHSVGPVKRVVKEQGRETTYHLHSYHGSPGKAPGPLPIRKLLPLRPGTRKTFMTGKNATAATEIKPLEKDRLHGTNVTPYVDHLGDIHYVVFDERGLVMPQRYWTAYDGLSAYPEPGNPAVIFPAQLEIGRLHTSFSHPRSFKPRSLTMFEENHPELLYASLPVCVEDVTVPMGTFRDCVKIGMFYNISNFELMFDVVRIGYIWLAPDTGIVKEHVINLYNYSLPQSTHLLHDVRFWELKHIDTPEGPVEKKAVSSVRPPPKKPSNTSPAEKTRSRLAKTGTEQLSWKGNSKAMFDRAVNASPFFIRPISSRQLKKAIVAGTGSRNIVTEDLVIECVKEVTPDAFVEKTLQDIESLYTGKQK